MIVLAKRKNSRKSAELPDLFIERLQQILAASDYQQVLNSFKQKNATSFRVNTLKADAAEIQNWLTDNGIKFKRHQELPNAFSLPNTTSREATEWSIYQEGKIYLQNLSSMVPPLVLAPQPGETVLDLTAAPGSKTTQIAAMMQCKGKLIANDKTYPRYKRMEANCELLLNFLAAPGRNQQENFIAKGRQIEGFMEHPEFLEIYNLPGEYIGKQAEGKFDKVLIDAPCSSEGQFCLAEPKSLGYWSRHKIKDMAYKQNKLLYAAIRACKPGGTIVYSTCTFAPEENERIVDKLVKKFAGVVEIDDLAMLQRTSTLRQGLTSWQDQEFAPELAKTGRVIPDGVYEGFYVAKLRKLADLVPE